MRCRASAMATASAAAGLTLVACSPGGGAAGPAASTSAAARPSATTGEPRTEAAVRADADDYLSLYSAGQYAITYQMLSTSARRAVSQQAWMAVHHGCPGGGLVYKIARVVVTGNTAVVTATLPGASRDKARQTETLVYADGHWGFAPRDLNLYQHGSVAADVAAARAQGGCAS
jgi:hypothetical protein